MPRDVTNRWNSTYDMLKFAFSYSEPINKITGERSMKIRQYEIIDQEWTIVEQLRDCLKIFKTVTLEFSSDTPCVANVIPAMDRMHKELTAASINDAYSPAIRAALKLGIGLLDKYYSLTDNSEIYRIAMVLHPKHKLKYFEKQGWDKAWITTAEEIVREEFRNNYAAYAIYKQKKKPQSSKKKVDSSDESSNDTDSDSSTDEEELMTELDRYLKTPRVKDVRDPLQWWMDNKSFYPRLSRMAKDFLVIPASSVAVERVFSKGRLLISHVRNRLSAQSTRALLCLGYWSKMGFVKPDDMKALPDEEDDLDSEVWSNTNEWSIVL